MTNTSQQATNKDRLVEALRVLSKNRVTQLTRRAVVLVFMAECHVDQESRGKLSIFSNKGDGNILIRGGRLSIPELEEGMNVEGSKSLPVMVNTHELPANEGALEPEVVRILEKVEAAYSDALTAGMVKVIEKMDPIIEAERKVVHSDTKSAEIDRKKLGYWLAMNQLPRI